jgi:hypothetical protein
MAKSAASAPSTFRLIAPPTTCKLRFPRFSMSIGVSADADTVLNLVKPERDDEACS